MISYDDIKDVLKKESLKDLAVSYSNRQKENQRIDEYYANSVLDELYFLENYVEKDLNYEQKILSYIILAQNADTKIRDFILKVFKLNDYKFNGELLRTMQFVDLLFNKELDEDNFKLFCRSAFNFEGANINKDEVLVKLSGVSIPMKNSFRELGLEKEIDASNRRHFCHDITSSFLLSMPKLYGAYYYVPLIFGGNIEHSVLIDPDKDLVYDVANNITISLSIFNAFYKNCSFIINGEYFSDIHKRIYDQYGEFFTTAHLEEVRIRKK